jgi:prephenate dehydrogenase (NADP+)
MVDCWYHLGICPYEHLICQTPPFRLRLGIVEYLFNDKDMLNDAITAAIYDKGLRGEDLHFYSATQGWAQCVEHGIMKDYQKRFESTSSFFKDRLDEASKLCAAMIKTILKNT